MNEIMSSDGGVRQISMSRFQRGGDGLNPISSHQITFLEANTDHRTRELYRTLINDFHQYKQWKDYPGRRIGWIVCCDEDPIGSIGIASSPMSLGDRDKWIGWNREQKLRNLVKIATNYRFSLAVRGLGSRILSKFHKLAKKSWKEKYGDNLVLLDTMVKPPWDGTVYKASGWTLVGKTKGFSLKRPPSRALIERELSGEWGKAYSDRAKLIIEKGWKEALKEIDYWEFDAKETEPKLIFVKPLHRYWRRQLLA